MSNPQLEDGYLKISNELMDALIKIRIPGECRQCLDFIMRKTYGFNKKEDSISLSQFEEATGLPRSSVARGLKRLVEMKMVVKTDAQYVTKYAVQKDYNSWVVTKKSSDNNVTTNSYKNVTKVVTKMLPKVVTKMRHTKDNKDNIQKTSKYRELAIQYNSICKSLPKVQNPEKLSDVRIRALKNRIKDYPDLNWDVYFKYIENNNFLAGRKLSWSANFDWIINKTNMAKIIEGQYRRDDGDNPDSTKSDVQRHNESFLNRKLREYEETNGVPCLLENDN